MEYGERGIHVWGIGYMGYMRYICPPPHSNHEWNDRADRLADRGRRGERLPAAPIVAD